MVEANAKCPKCAQGIMKLIPTPEQLAPKLPEKNKLTAQCDNCGHKDKVKVVATVSSGEICSKSLVQL